MKNTKWVDYLLENLFWSAFAEIERVAFASKNELFTEKKTQFHAINKNT